MKLRPRLKIILAPFDSFGSKTRISGEEHVGNYCCVMFFIRSEEGIFSSNIQTADRLPKPRPPDQGMGFQGEVVRVEASRSRIVGILLNLRLLI